MAAHRLIPSQQQHLRPAPRRAKLRRLWNDERGAATAELVLAIPLLLLLLLLIAQFAVWLHATHIAQAAASEALSATRVQGGTVAHGHAEANRVLQQLGSGPLHSPHASVSRGPGEASVHVEGTVTAVVPFLALTAVGDATGPVERFVPQSYGFANSEAVSDGNLSGGGG